MEHPQSQTLIAPPSSNNPQLVSSDHQSEGSKRRRRSRWDRDNSHPNANANANADAASSGGGGGGGSKAIKQQRRRRSRWDHDDDDDGGGRKKKQQVDYDEGEFRELDYYMTLPEVAKPGSDGEYRVRMKHLPLTVDESDLRTLFSPFGQISRTFILRDPETGDSFGHGAVDFANHQQALDAIAAMNGRLLPGSTWPLGVCLFGTWPDPNPDPPDPPPPTRIIWVLIHLPPQRS